MAPKDHGRDVPESIRGDENAQAFFGILDGQLETKGDEPVAGVYVAAIAQQIPAPLSPEEMRNPEDKDHELANELVGHSTTTSRTITGASG